MAAEGLVEFLVMEYGLVGLLVGSLIANASLFLVLPIDLIVLGFSATGFFPPVVIALVAGFGAAIGEMTGYILGLGGRKAIEKKYKRGLEKVAFIKRGIKHKGMVFIFLGALTPFPFDVIGIVAGLLHYDLKKFFFASFAGKTVRYALIGYAALWGTEILLKFFGVK